MARPYPIVREDILTRKKFLRKDLLRMTLVDKELILDRSGKREGRGIYLNSSFLKNAERLKKKLSRYAPGCDFASLYQEIRKWKADRTKTD